MPERFSPHHDDEFDDLDNAGKGAMRPRVEAPDAGDLDDLDNTGKGALPRQPEVSDLDDLDNAGKGDLTRSRELSLPPVDHAPEAVGDIALDGVGIVPTFDELDMRLQAATEEGQRQADALAPPTTPNHLPPHDPGQISSEAFIAHHQ